MSSCSSPNHEAALGMQASEATASKQELSRNAVSQLTSDDPEAAQRMLSAFQPPDSPLDADFTAFLRHFVPAVKREALRLFSQPRAAPLRPNSQGADASANGPADASACVALYPVRLFDVQVLPWPVALHTEV